MSPTETLTIEPDTAPAEPNQKPVREVKRTRSFPRASRTPFLVGEPLPNQLSNIELQRALNVKNGVFYKNRREGQYRRFEFRNPTDSSKPYSGVLVTKYLSGKGR